MTDLNKVEEDTDVDREKCLETFKKMLSENDHLKYLKTTDGYLERFLKVTDYNTEAAFEKISTFYNILEEHPTWFPRTPPIDKKPLIDRDMRLLLKNKDKEGRPIYIVKLAKMDPAEMDLLDVVAVDDFFVETLFLLNAGLEDHGLCVIVDVANFSLKLTKWLTPYNVKVAVKRILSMPIKNFRYHVINNSMLINVGIKLLFPFLPQEIKETVKFHMSDFEALYEYVDKDELPEEYGGSVKCNYSDQHSLLLDRNEEIFENFKLNRSMYLDIQSKNKPSDD